MPDLIAQGPADDDRWRRELPSPTSGVEPTLGRSASHWNVPWDAMISRNHLRLVPLPDDRMEVIGSTTARNPIFHHGRQSGRFTLVVGDHFVIGHTTFTLVNRPGVVESPMLDRHGALSDSTELTQHYYDPVALRRRHFQDAASRINMLGRLPDLIVGSSSDQELFVRVTNVMLQATPSASAVAIIQCDASGAVTLLHYDSRTGDAGDPSISATLVRDAIGKRESVLNVWSNKRSANPIANQAGPDFTADESVDWAFCVPLGGGGFSSGSSGLPRERMLNSQTLPKSESLLNSESLSNQGWAIYVSGKLHGGQTTDVLQDRAADDLQDDVKFTELVGTTVANLRHSRRLQRRQAQMRHFFAPVVLEALADQELDAVLKPREANLSVLFCDLRGFSKASEESADDLLGLLARVSDALGVMTHHIMEGQGVVGDFHGDAAMGFWGWPLEQPDAALRAVQAASKIRSVFRARGDTLGFRCGIGIASGRAVAGQIGTVDQVKVTAFGPVVNLASRLEGLTKTMGAEVILDQATSDAIAGSAFQTRSLGRVKPTGFNNDFEVSELIQNEEGS